MNPLDHYRQNKPVYDTIRENVKTTTEVFADAPRPVQKDLLNRAVTFALISAQAPVEQHEKGYLAVMDAEDPQSFGDALQSAGVNYCWNKAKYILHNASQVDYDSILDEYDAGRIDSMHREMADRCKGVGLRKAGFAMAKVVTKEKMCIDTHVAQQAGLDADNVYNGVVVDRYESQCQEVLDGFPDLQDRFDPFICQWLIFDAHREQVTTHDAWFMSLPEQVPVEV